MSQSASTNPIETLEDLQALFALMGTYNIAICELPGGVKIVKAPDSAPTVEREARPEPQRPQPIHEDPWLYRDGVVPSFDQ